HWLSGAPAPGGAPCRQGVDFGHAHAIEIAGDRLLERARRDGDPQRRVEWTAGRERVDQARREAVAAADAIDEADAIALALVHRCALLVPEHRTPAVVARR